MTWRISAAWGAVVFLASGLLVSPEAIVQAADRRPPAALAEELVLAALRAEVSGDDLARRELLEKALAADPDCAPARWHLGYVRMDNKWVLLHDAEELWAGDKRLAEYWPLRDRYRGTPAGELALAQWCQARGLEIPARFHWLGVLRFQPQHEQALKILGMRWHNGKLLTLDQIAKAQEKEALSKEARREHEKTREHWQEQERKSSQQRDALVDDWLKALAKGDADVGPSMRAALDGGVSGMGLDSTIRDRCTRSRQRTEKDALLTLSKLWIEILDASPDGWATRCLAADAIDHPFAEVRTAAADALRSRPEEDYVPRLARRIDYPVELSISLAPHAGGVSYVKRYYQEGEDIDSVDTVLGSRYVRLEPLLATSPRGALQGVAAATQARARVTQRALADAAQTCRTVAQSNAPILERNRRIQYALARATGHDREPQFWQEWLNDHERSYRDQRYDYYELENTREQDSQQAKPLVTRYYTLPSCFPHGTQVSTLVGLVPIEEVQVGDFVLSQDPNSGELAYKPVLEITTRSPAPMIRIGLGEETITATRGHPFWVPGEGWKMVKELEVGLRLHAASGAVMVEGLEPLPDPEPWHDLPLNLVVADFHTYFVGRQRVLVHDNLLFADDRTTTQVPGLLISTVVSPARTDRK